MELTRFTAQPSQEVWASLKAELLGELALALAVFVFVGLVIYVVSRLLYHLHAQNLSGKYPFWVDRDYSGHSFAFLVTSSLLMTVALAFLLTLWFYALAQEPGLMSFVILPLCIFYTAGAGAIMAASALKEWP